MCGITGILKFDNRKIDKKELLNFTKSLTHRGPDNIDCYINKKENLGFGHTRLSIIDLSSFSDQPMQSNDGRYVITYNGEIFNYLELKKELKLLGYKFKTTGDTEVLLNSFIQWGHDCNLKFNGMWAFAIWDNLKQELFISRDRFGEKPLFYFLDNKQLFFCSELKALQYLNSDSIPDFNYGYFKHIDKGPIRKDTFLKNVYSLGPGEAIKINADSKITVHKWWNTFENLRTINKKYKLVHEEFKDLLFSSIKLRMQSDVNTASSLSGGLDSSSIFASINYILNNENMKNFNDHSAFVLNYLEEENSETQFALSLLQKSQNKKYLINLGKEELIYNDLLKSIYHQEAIGDDALGPLNIFKNLNKNNIKVSIDGHGPDELLGGYMQYPKIAFDEINWKKNPFRYLDLRLTDEIMKNPTKNFAQLLRSVFLRKVLSSTKKNEVTEISSKKNYINYNDSNPMFYKSTKFDFYDGYNNALYNHFHIGGLPKILAKFDRLSMAYGVEVRSPFLDHNIVTFLFSLPSKYKIGNLRTKKILRESMRNILPSDIRLRAYKKGFVAENKWFSSFINRFIRDTINDKSFVNSEVVDGKSIKKDFENIKNINNKNIFRHLQVHYLVDSFKKCKIKNVLN